MEVRSNFHSEMSDIFNDVIIMGDKVVDQLNRGLECLVNGDTQAAVKIIEDDKIVDDMEIALEDRCAVILAKESPVATELREIITVLKITSELERLGDHARHLAENAGKVNKSGLRLAAPIFSEMLEYGCQMVKEALRSFIELDSAWAQEIASRDHFIDEKYHNLYGKLVDLIKDKPHKAENLVPLLFLNRHLERIGDRVTNICEFVVYSKTNKHIGLN